MANPYACILPTNAAYLPGALAFLNSFLEFGLQRYCDLVIPYHGWDVSIFAGADCTIVPYPVEAPGHKLQIVLGRNRAAAEFAETYQAVAMFDADMFLLSELRLFFEIAAAGMIVGSNNDTHQDQSAYRYADGWPICPTYSYKMVCNVPFFVSRRHAAAIYTTASEILTAEVEKNVGDLASFNLAISLHPDAFDQMLVIPSSQFTGIHHTNFKPQTFHVFDALAKQPPLPTRERINPEHFVITADYLPVHSVHGRYWTRGYVENLLKKMAWYFGDHLGMQDRNAAGWMSRATSIANRTQKIFLEYLLGGPVPFDAIRSYVHPNHLEYIEERSHDLKVNFPSNYSTGG